MDKIEGLDGWASKIEGHGAGTQAVLDDYFEKLRRETAQVEPAFDVRRELENLQKSVALLEAQVIGLAGAIDSDDAIGRQIDELDRMLAERRVSHETKREQCGSPAAEAPEYKTSLARWVLNDADYQRVKDEATKPLHVEIEMLNGRIDNQRKTITEQHERIHGLQQQITRQEMELVTLDDWKARCTTQAVSIESLQRQISFLRSSVKSAAHMIDAAGYSFLAGEVREAAKE